VQDVPAGAVVFLECGFRRHRLTPRNQQHIVVTVEELSSLHQPSGRHIKYLNRHPR
jgi:hypothetical protein